MLKIKDTQLIGSIIYDTGSQYDDLPEIREIIINKLLIDEEHIIINDHHYLFKREDGYYCSSRYYFSKSKANKMINYYIEMKEKRKLKYEKEQEIKRQYEQQIIDNKLREKYIDKFIMINRNNEWEKTKVKDIYATNKGIYLVPYTDGHICKLSREGNTWKMWSELEELEEQKKKLEERINILRGEDSAKD